MLLETSCLDTEEKDIENLSGNRLINLKILTTSIDKFLLRQKFAQEKDLKMKQEE